MKIVKTYIKFVIFGIAFILIILGLYALIHGSLEMTPTIEQQEKARIAGVIILALGVIAAIIGRILCVKR